MESRLKLLEEKLSRVESGAQPQESLIQSVFNQHTQKKRSEELIELQYTFELLARATGIELKNFFKVCTFAVEFVANNTPQIALLVGSALTGQIKFDIACQLVASLFSEIALELVGQSVQAAFDLTIDRKNNELRVQQIEDKVMSFPRQSTPSPEPQKKSCFPRRRKPKAGGTKQG
eukprot:Lithocolla_globosa_v1_NODE_2950_length_1814_cov_32.370097.p2 type:complete len:176 gc:universal NODE_2950_length_1814_cov_32.370097:123-650(+)